MRSKVMLATSLAMSATSLMAAEEAKRPNVLFICIDDLRTQIGAYGHDWVITPNLDRLASEGRLFTQQYVQVPTSGASRRAMLTGQYPQKPSHTKNDTYGKELAGTKEGELPESFIHHLKRNGYYTLGMGKISHHGNGHNVIRGNESLELPHSWDRFVNDPDWLWKREDVLHAYADGGNRRDRSNPAFEFLDVPDESYPDARLANLAITELENLANRKGDEPFFMAVGFYKPHLPFCAPRKYWDMYEDKDIELAHNKGLSEGVDRCFYHSCSEFNNQYTNPNKAGIGVVFPEDNARDLTRAYCAALTYSDTQVGRVLDKLEELGLDEDTIIVVWGDHGWNLGDHALWGKHNIFNVALNSTFMVKTPDMNKAGVAADGLVGTIDIYPTICELTGVPAPEGIDGVSITPMLENPKAKVRDEIFSYWHDQLTVRTDRYRFSVHDTDKHKAMVLFDHKSDPYETVNVAEKNPKVVDELMGLIKEQNSIRNFIPTLK